MISAELAGVGGITEIFNVQLTAELADKYLAGIGLTALLYGSSEEKKRENRDYQLKNKFDPMNLISPVQNNAFFCTEQLILLYKRMHCFVQEFTNL
ncbi:hypothetical protein [Bacteroides sedimenti]|uniref:Uncharacterized protein n=1 Tax=Bacteroides sedimenti TaxID=2136147 RepID=A0ABN6Z253_9BACE